MNKQEAVQRHLNTEADAEFAKTLHRLATLALTERAIKLELLQAMPDEENVSYTDNKD